MYNFINYKKQSEPYKFLTLSFDDSVKQDIRFARLLEKYKLKCTFNLNSGLFGFVHRIPIDDKGNTVNHSEIPKELVRRVYDGQEVAVHTLHHPSLDECDDEKAFHEIDDDRVALEELSGQKIIGMAYPGGPKYNDRTVEIIKTRTPLVYARDIINTHGFDMPADLLRWQPTCHWQSDSLLKRFDDFLAEDAKGDRLFYIWGHSYEFDIFNAWDRIEEIFAKISNREGVTYATNGEIASYILSL